MTYFSYPKINICLKILGILDSNYCDIFSRYRLVTNDVFDVMHIKDSSSFKIDGNFDCLVHENLIFKAKEALKTYLLSINSKKASYLESFYIEVDKNIPTCSGLGGGSSNAATYLLAFNEILELSLSSEILNAIASNIGADVSFFIYKYLSANVYGKGEIIKSFDDDNLEFSILTPPLKIKTKEIFDAFKKGFESKKPRKNPYLNLDLPSFSIESFSNLKSFFMLENYEISFLNDLFPIALNLYPILGDYAKDGYFFSGSGSSFFKIKNENNSHK